MSDFKHIDDLLKERLQNRSYVFKEAYWEAAEQLIIANQQKRRRGWIFWLFGALLATVVGLPILLWQASDTPASDSAQASVTTEIPFSENPVLSSPNADEKVMKLIPSNSLSGKNLIEKSDKSISQNKKKSPADVKGVKTTSFTQSINAKIFSNQGVQPTSSFESSLSNVTPEAITRGMNISGPSIDIPLDLTTGLKEAEPVSINTFSEKETIYGAFAAMENQPFSLSAGMNIPRAPFFTPSSRIYRRNSIRIIAGSDLAVGLQNTEAQAAPVSTNPVIGIQYGYRLNSSLTVHTGISYRSRGGLNSDSTYNSVEYRFGLETDATTISPQKLHYAEVPLYLEARFGGRHYLQAGLNSSWLVNSSSIVKKQRIEPFGTVDKGEEQAWGYTQGFRSYDPQLLVGYHFYLTRGIKVGVQGLYGLRDVTENDFFLNNTYDRNLQLRLSLTYHLFQF